MLVVSEAIIVSAQGGERGLIHPVYRCRCGCICPCPLPLDQSATFQKARACSRGCSDPSLIGLQRLRDIQSCNVRQKYKTANPRACRTKTNTPPNNTTNAATLVSNNTQLCDTTQAKPTPLQTTRPTLQLSFLTTPNSATRRRPRWTATSSYRATPRCRAWSRSYGSAASASTS